MHDLLREFWSRAECEEPTFSAEEIEWTPPGPFELLCKFGLLKETARATWACCDACGDGHVEDVVWIQNTVTGSSNPFIPCPENGGVPVSMERLRRWAIDVDAIAAAMRISLALIGNHETLVAGRVWSLGRRHLAGRFRDFFLIVDATRDDANLLGERCRQIDDAPSPVILVPSLVPLTRQAPVIRLAHAAAVTDAGITIDLDYLADALTRDTRATGTKTIACLAVPDGAIWADLRLTVREHSLRAVLRGVEREFSFDDLGMSGPNDRLWKLLCAFARLGGWTPARGCSLAGKDTASFRKQVSDLRRFLSTVFPIGGEPIHTVRGRGYRCLFQISLDRRDGFPVQPELWADCRLTELRDGRIAISARMREVYAAKTISGQASHRADIEAAERIAVRTEEYDLRTLSLANDIGHPTGEGRVLLALLRSGGKLTRRGDDKNVLRLAQRLREWMGIESEPLQFSPSRTLWSTLFESASHRPGKGDA